MYKFIIKKKKNKDCKNSSQCSKATNHKIDEQNTIKIFLIIWSKSIYKKLLEIMA